MAICRNCKAEFDDAPIWGWGKLIKPVRCERCRKSNAKYQKALLRMAKAGDAPHPTDHEMELNPGGYCVTCGWGRDFS